MKSNPDKYIFDPPASEEEIEKIELITGIELPKSYKKFLLKFNGGFICPTYFKGQTQDQERLATAKWNTLTIFSLQELFQRYQELDAWNWKLYNDWQGVYPIIPIARAVNNELLVIINPLNNGESPVFDAFHEEPYFDWGILSDNFADFLENYLELEGKISTISSSDETAEDYLPQSGWKFIPNDDFSDEDYLKYFSLKLEMEPDDYITLCDCSRFYLNKNDTNSALFYANKAIASSPESDWGYYHRFLVYREQNKLELALKDILQVNKINPERSLYLAEIGDIYLDLQEYEKAIEFSKRAIDVNPTFAVPYMTLEKIYRTLDNEELADEYADLATDFLNEDY